MVSSSNMDTTSQGSISQLKVHHQYFSLYPPTSNIPESAARARDHEECGEEVDTGDDEGHDAGVVNIGDEALDKDVQVLPGGVVQVVVGVCGV